jgi:hypothetical protein
MDSLVGLFVQLIIFFIIFGLFYWIATLVPGLLPAPIQPQARTILLILLALIALCFLLGIAGLWGTWGWGYTSHRGPGLR